MRLNAILLSSLLFLVLVMQGCNEAQPQIPVYCSKPYILVGTGCCLDKNDNNICDKNENINENKDLKINTSSESYCAFTKAENGRKIILDPCPAGKLCVETGCVFVMVTSDAGKAYACDGICK